MPSMPALRASVRPLAPWSRGVCVSLFLILALPLCLWFALRTPLGDVADEPSHLMRAASLLDGQVLGRREAITLPEGGTVMAAGVDVDPVWALLSRSRDPSGVLKAGPPPDPTVGLRPADQPAAFFPIYTIATYCPVFYVPAALGLGAARGLGLSARGAAIAGRLASALAFAGIAVAALALARRGRMLLFVVLALPMTLSLAASFNQDGLIIASAALAASLVTRGWNASGPLHRRPAGLAAAVVIALIVLAKPPYAPLASLLLVPISRRSALSALVLRAGVVALVLLPGLIWTGYAATTVATSIPRDAYEAGPLWPGLRPALFHGTDPAAQLRVLVADPARFVTVPATYLGASERLMALALTAIGVLGWLDRPLPGAVYLFWIVAFAALALQGRARDLSLPETVLLPAAALACLWAVILSQYMSWMNVGSGTVLGLQGRYLLPILPLLAPMLAAPQASGATAFAGWRRVVETMPYLAAAMALALVPSTMAG